MMFGNDQKTRGPKLPGPGKIRPKPYSPVSIALWLYLLYMLVVAICITLLQLLIAFGADFKPEGSHGAILNRNAGVTYPFSATSTLDVPPTISKVVSWTYIYARTLEASSTGSETGAAEVMMPTSSSSATIEHKNSSTTTAMTAPNSNGTLQYVATTTDNLTLTYQSHLGDDDILTICTTFLVNRDIEAMQSMPATAWLNVSKDSFNSSLSGKTTTIPYSNQDIVATQLLTHPATLNESGAIRAGAHASSDAQSSSNLGTTPNEHRTVCSFFISLSQEVTIYPDISQTALPSTTSSGDSGQAMSFGPNDIAWTEKLISEIGDITSTVGDIGSAYIDLTWEITSALPSSESDLVTEEVATNVDHPVITQKVMSTTTLMRSATTTSAELSAPVGSYLNTMANALSNAKADESSTSRGQFDSGSLASYLNFMHDPSAETTLSRNDMASRSSAISPTYISGSTTYPERHATTQKSLEFIALSISLPGQRDDSGDISMDTVTQLPTGPFPHAQSSSGRVGVIGDTILFAAVASSIRDRVQQVSSLTDGSSSFLNAMIPSETGRSYSETRSGAAGEHVGTSELSAAITGLSHATQQTPASSGSSRSDQLPQDGTGAQTESMTSKSIPAESVTTSSTSVSTSSKEPTPTGFVELRKPNPMSSDQYFAIRFVPKVLAIAMHAIWSVSHAGIVLMEPFIEMASSNGGSARNTLLAGYLSSDINLRSLADTTRGHWKLFLANLVALSFFVIIMLINEAFTIKPTAFCKTLISERQPCGPALYGNAPVIHTIQALLGLVLVLVATIAMLSHKQNSQVFSDPSKLASLATLLGNDTFRRSLLAVNPDDSHNWISNQLLGRSFRLGYFVDEHEHQRYGITETSTHEPTVERKLVADRESEIPSSSLKYLYQTCRRVWFETVILLLILAQFSVILAYYLSDSGRFNDFMNSGTLAPSIMLSTSGVLITFGLRAIERRERISEIYRRMLKAPQDAESSVLVSLGGTPYTGIFYGFVHKWRFVSVISLTTILADFMQISLSGVPWQSGDTLQSYKLCSYLSLSLLAFMGIVIVAIMWKRRTDLNIHSPGRLITALLYLSGSNFVQDQNGMGDDSYLHQIYQGRKFRLVKTNGPDGSSRWTINDVSSQESDLPALVFDRHIPEGQDVVQRP